MNFDLYGLSTFKWNIKWVLANLPVIDHNKNDMLDPHLKSIVSDSPKHRVPPILGMIWTFFVSVEKRENLISLEFLTCVTRYRRTFWKWPWNDLFVGQKTIRRKIVKLEKILEAKIESFEMARKNTNPGKRHYTVTMRFLEPVKWNRCSLPCYELWAPI